MNPFIVQLLGSLQSTGYRDLAGARVVADVPLADEWLNAIITAAIGNGAGPVRELNLRTLAGNHAQLRVRLTKFSFVPVNVDLFIERQPEIPSFPVVVFRWETMSAPLTALATQAVNFAKQLPPGFAIGGDRIAIDLFVVLEQRGLGWLIPLIERVQITTEPGRLLLHLVLAAPGNAG